MSADHPRFRPLIQAISDPSLDEIGGLDDISTEDLVEYINNGMPYDIVLALAIKNTDPQKGYGFVLNPRAFKTSADKGQRIAAVLHALLKKFAEAQENISTWEMYAGTLRK